MEPGKGDDAGSDGSQRLSPPESRGPPGEGATVTSLYLPPDELAPTNAGRTLLPNSLARAISLATRSTSLLIQTGAFIGGLWFSTAKFTTLSTLELSRGIVGGLLTRAGKDVIDRSRSELGRDDAETLLERTLDYAHQGMTAATFAASAGFQVAGTAASFLSDMSQLLLVSLDQFFGSTDSSRAIASIITLVCREFQNPATGMAGEKVGVVDLVLGICGLAYLQRWCWRLSEEDNRRLQVEEVVWDVVVLSGGERVDIRADQLISGQSHSGVSRIGIEGSDGDEISPEVSLERHISSILPPDAQVSITTSTQTTKLITLEVTSSHPPSISPVPGMEIVEESRYSATGAKKQQLPTQSTAGGLMTYRVVYRLDHTKLTKTGIPSGEGVEEPPRIVEQVDNTDDDKANDEEAAVTWNSERDTPVNSPPLRASAITPKTFNDQQRSPPADQRQQRKIADQRQTQVASTITKPLKTPTGGGPLAENSANQKRPRAPPSPPLQTRADNAQARQPPLTKLLPKRSSTDLASTGKAPTKKGGIRNALKKGPALNVFSAKEAGDSSQSLPGKGKKPPTTIITASSSTRKEPAQGRPGYLPVSGRTSSVTTIGVGPHARRAGLDPGAAMPRQATENDYRDFLMRSPSRTSYYSVNGGRRDSIISQSDTISIHSIESYRPVTPTLLRTDVSAPGQPIAKSKSEKHLPSQASPEQKPHHRRARTHMPTPSIYTLNPGGSQTSLVLASCYNTSAFKDYEALNTLRQRGMVDEMFPRAHLLRNITRYMSFSSASYGSSFLKVMGIQKEMPLFRALDDTHHNVRSFAHHTESETNSVLLSSFVDPQGGSDGTGSTNTGLPLIHYISLDHESNAVVLTCRGTLGFEDVLADMTCDYDDLPWRGRSYKVHKGVHASARRLLYGGDGRVLFTLKAALEEYSEYGLILTGHSLGGAVTALLGVMLAEPAASGTSFVTSGAPYNRLLGDGRPQAAPHSTPVIGLPPGRPVHVYAYGPPGTMSPGLRQLTRGLITTVVQGNDLVPYLSLGVLHDFQAVALAFKSDNSDAKTEVRQRIWQAFQTGLAERWYGHPHNGAAAATGILRPSSEEEDKWGYAALKTLRASMMNEKLLPPGEVFVVETTRVLRREAFVARRQRRRRPDDKARSEPGRRAEDEHYDDNDDEEDHFGRPARRVVLKYVRDVEARFREVRFTASMLTDHNPAKYEDALNRLKLGVINS